MFIENKMYMAIFFLVVTATMIAAPRPMIITEAVVDVRGEMVPVPFGLTSPALSKEVGSQNTQLLLNERILASVDANAPDWLKIEALEQRVYGSNGWVGCAGYIKKNQAQEVERFSSNNLVVNTLWADIYKDESKKEVATAACFGTHLKGEFIDENWCKVALFKGQGYIRTKDVYLLSSTVSESSCALRAMVVNGAKKFIETPYLWGGRCAYNKKLEKQITGADCSGLMNLVFRAVGLQIPRNSHHQYLAAQKIQEGKQMRPADLIFFGYKNTLGALRVNHVMMYIGDGLLIEATGDPNGESLASARKALFPNQLATRIIGVNERIGTSIDQLIGGQAYKVGKDDKVVLLGAFLNSGKAIQTLRNNALDLEHKKINKS